MDERWISIIIGAIWFIVFFLLLGAIACGLFLIYLKLDDIVDQLKK